VIYRKLGKTNIDVSVICLGSMTWGEQNNEQQAHQQLDYACDRGINFIDTAEMYPVPPKADSYGLTEQYIGSWLKKRDRSKLVVASKVAGRADWLTYVRNGNIRFDRKNIVAALDASLKRLQTDYIDLYQLHWPDRQTNYFGKRGYSYPENEISVPFQETLTILDEQVKLGKIRHIGLSNETPWGVMQCLTLSQQHDLARIVTIQNPYNLLNRTYEIGLAEFAHRESVGLLAYSPMAFGVLSGKYLNGQRPAGARLTLFERFQRYTSDNAQAATQAYVDLAKKAGLSPAKMALAYVNSRPFLTSNIIGATTMEQLRENIASLDITLSPEICAEIESIHEEIPNPCP